MRLAALRAPVAVVGMVTGVAGMLLANAVIVWCAIGMLALAMALRFAGKAGEPDA